MRAVAAARQAQLLRSRQAPRDAVKLGKGAVLVVFALNQECRDAEAGDVLVDRPVRKPAIDPDVMPLPKGGAGIAVILAEPVQNTALLRRSAKLSI